MDALTAANLEFARSHPGERPDRQPVHVMYGGAHLFKRDLSRKSGALAELALADYAPDAATFAPAFGIPSTLAESVYSRVVEKLRREPVESFCLDFEDGFGVRSDAEEDATAASAALEVASGFADGTLPEFVGIRIKALTEESKKRAFRTLERFVTALLEKTGGRLPRNFSVTLPKITVVEQVSAFADAIEGLGVERMELMIETPQSLMLLPRLIEAARGRCVAVHFGAYDYTASLGIAWATLLHPVCDFARSTIQIGLAGTGVWLSDGATNILPVAKHRGERLTVQMAAENRATVQAAWKTHYRHVRHALNNGFYQGWDLHPAQLPARYAAVYTFFLEGIDAASERLRNFIAKAARATLVGDVFDDAATGQGLLNYFLRAINCGAIEAKDAPELTGLSMEELRSGSFAKILEGRKVVA
jgi:citrate lyase beta subunit